MKREGSSHFALQLSDPDGGSTNPEIMGNRSLETETAGIDAAQTQAQANASALVALELLRSKEYGQFLAFHYALYQNSRMTFLEFVRTKFIPEHVMSMGPAGRRYYHSILKHILKPESADALFHQEATRKGGRLTSVPGWPYLDEIRLCDITPDHVRDVVGAASRTEYSSQTVTHIRSVIGTIIAHAAKHRCFSGGNPTFQVPVPK